MSGKFIPAIPGGMRGVVFEAEPVRTSDRLAKIVREMAESGVPSSFARRLSSLAIDVRHMEAFCDEAAEASRVTDAELAAELARPGTNLSLLRSA